MKRFISFLLALTIILSSGFTAYATEQLTYDEVQMTVFIDDETDSFYQLKTLIVDGYVMASFDDLKFLTKSDIVNYEEMTIIKGKKTIEIQDDYQGIVIKLLVDNTSIDFEHELPTRAIKHHGELYLPMEDLLILLDAKYHLNDDMITIFPTKVTFLDYITSVDSLLEFDNILFDFGDNIGFSGDAFYDLANNSSKINALYNGASCDVFRWWENIDRLLGSFSGTNTELRKYYSEVLDLMMSNSALEEEYIQLESANKVISDINSLNVIKSSYSKGFKSLMFLNYGKKIDDLEAALEILDESEDTLKKIGFTASEINDAFTNKIVETNLRKGGFVPDGVDSSKYVNEVNRNFDQKLYGKVFDYINVAGTSITSGVNVFHTLQNQFNKNTKKICIIEDVFVNSKYKDNYPKELIQASDKTVSTYKDGFRRYYEVFLQSAYSATKDGQLYDWIDVFSSNSVIGKASSKLSHFKLIWDIYNYVNFCDVKDIQEGTSNVFHTLAAHKIVEESRGEVVRRYNSWLESNYDQSNLENIKNPMICSMLASQVAYSSMNNYYLNKKKDFLDELKKLEKKINSKSNDKKLMNKKKLLVEKINKVNSIINHIENQNIKTIKIAYELMDMPLPVTTIDYIERFDIKDIKEKCLSSEFDVTYWYISDDYMFLHYNDTDSLDAEYYLYLDGDKIECQVDEIMGGLELWIDYEPRKKIKSVLLERFDRETNKSQKIIITTDYVVVDSYDELIGMDEYKNNTIKGLTYNISSKTDIRELSTLTNLNHLVLDECQSLLEIDSLSNLTNLKRLEMWSCENIVDISSLTNIKGLKELSISEANMLYKFDDLNSLKNLENIYIYSSPKLRNLNFINNLNSLKRLDVLECENLDDISGMNNAKNLSYISLYDNKSLKDYSPISKLKKLKKLMIDFNNSKIDISLIESNTELQVLQIWNTNSINLDSLLNLQKLQSLEIFNGNLLKDISGLEKLNNLRRLKLTCCKNITDFHSLVFLFGLEDLDLSGNKNIKNLDFLLGMKKLKRLNMNNCENLLEVKASAVLGELEYLDLSHCKSLVNIKALEFLDELEYLNLSHSHSIISIKELKNLTNLKELYLKNCDKLSDLKGIKNLKGLKILDLSFCDRLNDISNLSVLNNLEMLRIGNLNSTVFGEESLKDIKKLKELFIVEYDSLINRSYDYLSPSTKVYEIEGFSERF